MRPLKGTKWLKYEYEGCPESLETVSISRKILSIFWKILYECLDRFLISYDRIFERNSFNTLGENRYQDNIGGVPWSTLNLAIL